jgi:mono/diheme cytochrome c family protein
MDQRVVRAAAKTQGYAVTLVPFVGIGKGGDGFPLSRFAKMAGSDCELIMGFPVDLSNPNLPPDLKATPAYATTGFVLVRRGDARTTSLGELPNGSEVGISQLDTYAGLLFSSYPNIAMHVYPTDLQMLRDLAASHISAGIAWQPLIENYLRKERPVRSFSLAALPGMHMVWNLVALYAPTSEAAAGTFAKGLDALQSDRQLDRLIQPYRRAGATAGKAVDIERPKVKRSRVPALYTAEQATNGALAYYQNCAMCHAPLLDGQSAGYSAPALKGPEFADPSYDFHVSDIFNFVAKLMPAATPGSLTPDQDVIIMAFILQQNGYPAGNKELTFQEAAKSKVAIRFYGR